MEGMAIVAQRPDRPRRRVNSQREHSRYDQALGAAKNAGTPIRFTLLQEARLLDDDCEIKCYIVQVDKFDIEVEIFDPMDRSDGQKVWIKKSSIMLTEVLS